MRRRVAITGLGVVSPLGHEPGKMFDALCAGKSGVGPITHFDASTFPTRFAAEVREFDLGRYLRDASPYKHCGPNTLFALAATQQALADAKLLHTSPTCERGIDTCATRERGIDTSATRERGINTSATRERAIDSSPTRERGINPERIGIYLGCGEGTQDFHALISVVAHSYRDSTRAIEGRAMVEKGMELYHPGREYAQELHTTPGHVAECFGLEGPNYNCLTSCAAGNQAIGEAALMIRRGDADAMVAGGSHSIVHPLGVTGFTRLTALSTRNDEPAKASRPFDQKRDGFVMGEGAGILILEEMEHARRRGANIYAELTGYGVTADAFRVTDNHPEGRNAVLCMQACLADAGLSPEDIGYINAHGTSTQLNDKVETLAIKKTFGAQAYRIPVSSTKSMIGHLIGAAGAVEAVVCVLALRRGLLPPTINYEFPDPDCDLDYVPNQARATPVRHALSNSFGFGGQNVSLIISA